MRVLYHLATRRDWDAAAGADAYAPSDGPDGDLLCAGAEHYVALANHMFAGRRDVLLLFVDASRLPTAPRPGVAHDVPVLRCPPPLPTAAVFEVVELDTDGDGRFVAHHETAALAVREDDTLARVRERAREALGGWDRPWWIAGGWALDLHLGRATRPHADLELSILAADQAALRDHLRDWDLRAVAPGSTLVPWDGRPLPPPFHQVWARRAAPQPDAVDDFGSDPTMLGFLLEDHDGDAWRYRRDHRVSRALREFGDARDGVSYVRPEIALLFKAKQPRHKDRRDFRNVAPSLHGEARAWLRAALDVAHPGHPWAAALRGNTLPRR